MTSGAGVVIAGHGLVKDYRRGSETIHALRGADVVVHAGEVVGLAGASGSGKSTLLAVLCGWEREDSGSVTHVAGVDVADLPWSELALVPQTLGLLEDLTVAENVALASRLSHRRRRPSGRRHPGEQSALLERLGLTHLAGRLPSEVSIGEQQRTAIARALLARPRLLLADEPTAHQDRVRAQQVIDAIRERAAAGGGALVISHEPQTLDDCDRVLTMADGVLLAAAA